MERTAGPRKELGTRYTCFSCGTKFYDLHRPVPTCPRCRADQRENPNIGEAKPVFEPPKRPPQKKRAEPPPSEAAEVEVDSPDEEKTEPEELELDDDFVDEEIK